MDANSPYARQAEYATVDAVTLDDLKAWHDRTVVPNNMIVAVSGDFDGAAMEAKLRKAFEPLQKGAPHSRPRRLSFPGPTPGVYFVDKERREPVERGRSSGWARSAAIPTTTRSA